MFIFNSCIRQSSSDASLSFLLQSNQEPSSLLGTLFCLIGVVLSFVWSVVYQEESREGSTSIGGLSIEVDGLLERERGGN